MSGWSPPAVPRTWLAGIALLYALLLGYLILVVHQILLGVVVGILLASIYLVWRFIVAVEAIADAQQRIAHQREED